MRVQADYQLRGRAKRLERLIGSGLPRVLVELELVLVRLADGGLVIADSYSEEALAADGSVNASIVALNQATARIFERFLADAARTTARHGKPRQTEGRGQGHSVRAYSLRAPAFAN